MQNGRTGSITPRIGLLALQGAFRDHIPLLSRLSCTLREVRTPGDLQDLHGIILPGGESTVMARYLREEGILLPLQKRIQEGLPVWGICAGAVLLARESDGRPGCLQGIDMAVKRNAWGRQIHSSSIPLEIPPWQEEDSTPFNGVFIRAPRILSTGKDVEIMARRPDDNSPVLVRERQCLASSFHPELQKSLNPYRYFLNMTAAFLQRDSA